MILNFKYLALKALMNVRVIVFFISSPFIFLLAGCERIPHEYDIAFQGRESSGWGGYKCSVDNFSVKDENQYDALSEQWGNTDDLFKVDCYSCLDNKKYTFNLEGGSSKSDLNWMDLLLCNKTWFF